jgi:glyoxylase-like metal-dependent hydrolase (beta-lactamase superfamily II)
MGSVSIWKSRNSQAARAYGTFGKGQKKLAQPVRSHLHRDRERKYRFISIDKWFIKLMRVEMEITQQVYLIPGLVANTYVIVEPEGLTLIDAGLPNNSKKIISFIQSLGYQPEAVQQIIITHADIDHVGSLEAVRTAVQARVAASPVEAEAIRAGKASRSLHGGLTATLLELASRFYKAKPSQVDEILSGGEELPVLGGLQVIPTPGHTPGHISLWSPSTKVLFSGDSILIRSDHFLPSQGMNNWDQAKSNESYRLQAGLHPAVICGGHGWTDQDIDRKFNLQTF